MRKPTSKRSAVSTARRNARLDMASNRAFAQLGAEYDRRDARTFRKFLALKRGLESAVKCWGIETETGQRSESLIAALDELQTLAELALSPETKERRRQAAIDAARRSRESAARLVAAAVGAS